LNNGHTTCGLFIQAAGATCWKIQQIALAIWVYWSCSAYSPEFFEGQNFNSTFKI